MKLSEIKDLNERAKIVHQANIKWWQNPATGEPIERNKRELLMLATFFLRGWEGWG